MSTECKETTSALITSLAIMLVPFVIIALS